MSSQPSTRPSRRPTRRAGAKLRNLQAAFDRLEAELAGRDYDPRERQPRTERRSATSSASASDEYAAKLDAADRKAEQYRADLAAHKIEAEEPRRADQAGEPGRRACTSNWSPRSRLEAKLSMRASGRVDAQTAARHQSWRAAEIDRADRRRRATTATALSRNGSANFRRKWRRPAPTVTPARRGCQRPNCATTLAVMTARRGRHRARGRRTALPARCCARPRP